MALDLTYTLILNTAGDKTFTMPTGFEENVEIHCWGAGGGGSLGVSGGGGGYATTNAPIPAGSVVRLQVGQPGANGGRGNRSQSPGGTHPTYTRYRGGSAGSSRDEDADTGSGGGGGGASAVLVDGSPVCVGAGGGGAGGPGDDSRRGTPGNPGGVYPGSSTNVYPVTLSYAWNSFMNSYAVWGGGQDYTVILNFPVTGTYTFNYAVDNYGQVFLDGSSIISYAGFTATTTYTATVSAGNHTVRITGVNTGGPAGVAAQILKPDTTELWNSRALTVSSGLTATSDGGTSSNAWSSGGGGGGGYYGGEAGASYGDDAGNAPAGRGGQNYGSTTVAGIGAQAATRATGNPYLPASPPYGDAGYSGYIYIKFTRKPGLQIKNPDSSGDWVTITNSYFRTSPPRPGITADNKIFNTVGTTSYTIPKEVTSLSITYLTPDGLVTTLIPVAAGSIIPVTVGDYGQASAFGSFAIPAYNKQVFRYIGNVDHLLNADVQIANTSGNPLTTGGYNAGQTAAAAAAGLYYNVTYEGWHGDLYSTLYFTPVPTSQLLGDFQIAGAGGGRAGGPTITAQPTSGNGYRMGIQIYDPYSSEGGYDTQFILQQRGWFRIEYNLPIVVNGWKEIQEIYVKNGNVWKPITQQNDISVYNYK